MVRALLLLSLLAALSLPAVAQTPATVKLTKQEIETVQDQLHQPYRVAEGPRDGALDAEFGRAALLVADG